MIQHSKLLGLVAAPFTPMNVNGSINLDAIEGYADWLHRQGVVGAFICGTTGEGMSLTIDERKQIAERWVAAAPRELRVIVHVGHTALADCQTLASHAAAIGGHSISGMAPFFFRPHGINGLVTWCEKVASAAPNLPFYYYHIPSMTGVSISVAEFLQAAAPRVANLAGVKFTFEDLDDYRSCLEFAGGRFDILFGRDELLLSSLEVGARGAVGSTYNFAAPLYLSIIDAFRRGDLATASGQQELAVKMIDILVHGGVHPVATFKWFMSRVGINCGPARLPLVTPTDQQIAEMETQLDALGVVDLLKNFMTEIR